MACAAACIVVGEKNADGTTLDSYVDANGIVQTVHYIPDALGYTHLEPPGRTHEKLHPKL